MKYTLENDEIIYLNIQDFSLEETFLCGQAFRFDPFEKGFKGFMAGALCYVRYEGENLWVQVLNVPITEELVGAIYHFLALDIDYATLKKKFSQDETLKKAIEYARGIRVLNQGFFETLITFIISQNNNIPRIKKLADTLAQRYGSSAQDSFAFPTAEQLKEVTQQDYMDMKFGFRAKYLYDAVQKVVSGEIKEENIKAMTYPDAKNYLMQIKGVGPKVADCVLLFSCEKYESFPHDVWINRAMEIMFPEGLPQVCCGYEGIAQQYIFHYARFNIKK
ncbi:MAG: DNA glycosylase [Oscillospiraceae bacterium]